MLPTIPPTTFPPRRGFVMLRTAVRLGVFVWLATGSSLCLAADPPAVIRSAKSGPWSAGETWVGGKVPAAGARVHVLAGHVVTYDVSADDVIRAINVAGTLTFAKDKDTL